MLLKITCNSLGAETTVSAVSVLVLLSHEEIVLELHVDVLLELLGELLGVWSSCCSGCSTSLEAADSSPSSEFVGVLGHVCWTRGTDSKCMQYMLV
jgi:hypothetical protein